MRKYIKAVMLVNGLYAGITREDHLARVAELRTQNPLPINELSDSLIVVILFNLANRGLPERFGIPSRSVKDLLRFVLKDNPQEVIDQLITTNDSIYIAGEEYVDCKKLPLAVIFSAGIFTSTKLSTSNLPQAILCTIIYLKLAPYVLSKCKLHLTGRCIVTKESENLVYNLLPIPCRMILCISIITSNLLLQNDILQFMMIFGSFILMNIMCIAEHILYVNDKLIVVTMKDENMDSETHKINYVQKLHTFQAFLYGMIPCIAYPCTNFQQIVR